MVFKNDRLSWVLVTLIGSLLILSPWGANKTAMGQDEQDVAEDQSSEQSNSEEKTATGEFAPSVGVPATIRELILPGTELEAADTDFRGSIVVRILGARRHGTSFRYDIEYYGLDPGSHDLRDYLTRKDGSSIDDVPPIPVTIRSILPPGQVVPHELDERRHSSAYRYRLWLIFAGLVWLGGLCVLLFGWRKSKADAFSREAQAPLSLADRLRPLVEQAMAGTLPAPKLAELEMSLLAYWREKLKLEHLPPRQALQELKKHEDAGPLLVKLETWLHQPGNQDPVDPTELLRPYQNLAADALPPSTASSRSMSPSGSGGV